MPNPDKRALKVVTGIRWVAADYVDHHNDSVFSLIIKNGGIAISSVIKFIVETPIPKAKRSGIGKLNNPAQRRV